MALLMILVTGLHSTIIYPITINRKTVQKPYKFLELKKKEIIFGTKLYLNRENLKIVYNDWLIFD